MAAKKVVEVYGDALVANEAILEIKKQKKNKRSVYLSKWGKRWKY